MLKKGNEIPTIDVNLVTISTKSKEKEIALNTASKVAVALQTETQEAVKLIVKGRLIAQKPEVTTVTGNQIILTDNVFNPEVVKIIQGGIIEYWTDGEHSSSSTTETEFGIAKYTPPVAGSADKGEIFTLSCYSAQYDESGQVVQYEKITYPNCMGVPIALQTEDNVFRVNEITINSAPASGEAPCSIEYVKALPEVA